MRIVAPSAPLVVAAVLALSTSHVVRAEETSRSFEIYGFAQVPASSRTSGTAASSFRPRP